jgi:hypothetical protein
VTIARRFALPCTTPTPPFTGIRIAPVQPTRLFVDATSTRQWRDRNLFSVLPEGRRGDSAAKDSALEQLLLMHKEHDFEPNSRLPGNMELGLKRNNFCPSRDEIEEYKEAFPDGGVPLAVTGLTDTERKLTPAAWEQARQVLIPAG